jgi:hypothetical protein
VSRAHEGPLAFAHIGDLHLTRAAEPNFVDLLSIVAQLEVEFGAALDFAVLPGDNADNGLPSQYRLAATALKMLSVPVHAIAGDHDMEQGGSMRSTRVSRLTRSRGPSAFVAIAASFSMSMGRGAAGPISASVSRSSAGSIENWRRRGGPVRRASSSCTLIRPIWLMRASVSV